jgi:hypothetical protein
MMNETHIHDPRPLARNEIESVLQLSRDTAYVPRENRPGLRDKSFVKRPLVEIAQAADASATSPMPDAATPETLETGDGAPSSEAEATATSDNMAGEETQNAQPTEPDMTPAVDMQIEAGEMPADIDIGSDGDNPQAAMDDENATPPVFEPTPVAQVAIPTDAEVQDRIDEAYARGLSEGDGQARQRLEDGCQRLENLATSLMGHDALDIEQLGRHIEGTVMRLASLRAGYAIKDIPAPFADIIEQLVMRVSKEASGGTVYLNTADLGVVQPLLESRDSFAHISFKADDAILPGDIRVSVGSVEADDRLSQRAGLGAEDAGGITEFDEVGRLMRNLLDETPNDASGDTPTDTPTDTPNDTLDTDKDPQ